MDVHFVDTTFRDGMQSLWASGIRYGIMDAVADDIDRAGFAAVEVPASPIFFKKMVRDLRENPWDVMRMLARKLPNTVKTTMGGWRWNLNGFGTPTPPVLGELFSEKIAEIGVLDRAQLVCNTNDQLTRMFPTLIPTLREHDMGVAIAVAYSLSPRHTDEYFADVTRRAAAFRPDAIYLKDQCGLLTVDRIRTLFPLMVENAGGIPVELHSHCTTGLAPLVYLEALDMGVAALHCGIPPLADGSAQPSVLATARNARLMGHNPVVDERLLASVSERLMAFAKQDGLPIGTPTAYDVDQYNHQVPGGVISNLRFQLSEIGLEQRLDEVLQECKSVRADLGYPMMITPYSQFIGTQSAIHVATGQRWQTVIDPLIRFAQGAFGEDSGYTYMDENLRDRLVGLPRARELAAQHDAPMEDVTLEQARAAYGGPGLSDEDLLLRAIMQNTKDVDAMHAAGPPRSYSTSAPALVRVLDALRAAPSVRYVQLSRGGDSMTIANRERQTA